MGSFILRRLLQMIPLLLGISLLTFTIANVVPGNPVSQIEAELRERRRVSPEDVERIKRNLGLDQPMHVRYVTWLTNLMRADFGVSLKNFRPVTAQIAEKLPNTLLLTGTALAIALFFAIPLGVYSAFRRNSPLDTLTTAVSIAGFSVPTFWLALVLLLIFAVQFREWGLPSLPAGGTHDLRGGGDIVDRIRHLLLPAFTLAFVQIAYWTRFVRSQMLEVLSQDYIRTARAKGLAERVTLFRHGLRNALIPMATLVGLTIPELFGGALIIEQIFTWPGLGQLAYEAAVGRDYPLIMGTVMFSAVLVIVGNLLADLLYSVLDPRIRYE